MQRRENQTPDWRRVCPYLVDRGWDLNLTFHTILPPHGNNTTLHGVALGIGKGIDKQNKERSLEDADVQVPEGPWGMQRSLGVMINVFY